MRKSNKKNEIVKFKTRLTAQDFSQRLKIDYKEMYPLLMDEITFKYFLNLEVFEKLKMRLIDVVTTYIYR